MIFELWRDSNSRAVKYNNSSIIEVTHFTASDFKSENTKTGLNDRYCTTEGVVQHPLTNSDTQHKYQ